MIVANVLSIKLVLRLIRLILTAVLAEVFYREAHEHNRESHEHNRVS